MICLYVHFVFNKRSIEIDALMCSDHFGALIKKIEKGRVSLFREILAEYHQSTVKVNGYLVILPNWFEAGLCSSDTEIAALKDMLDNEIPRKERIFLKFHPRSSELRRLHLSAVIEDAEYAVQVLPFQYPVEAFVNDNTKICCLISTAIPQIYFLNGKIIKNYMTKEKINQYKFNDKQYLLDEIMYVSRLTSELENDKNYN